MTMTTGNREAEIIFEVIHVSQHIRHLHLLRCVVSYSLTVFMSCVIICRSTNCNMHLHCTIRFLELFYCHKTTYLQVSLCSFCSRCNASVRLIDYWIYVRASVIEILFYKHVHYSLIYYFFLFLNRRHFLS